MCSGGLVDQDRFDDLARSLTNATPRRSAVRGLAGGLLAGLLGWGHVEDAEAHDKTDKCKKLDGDKKKKCLKKAKKHKKKHANETPSTSPQTCNGVTCPDGQVCCPDQKCGVTCCANGRACNVVCSGPNGNDYCCDASRPAAICGGCWQAGSTQCSTSRHCCGPNQRCCGAPPYDHCCDVATEQCLIGCGGIPNSATCCVGGQSPRCCPEGTSA